MNATALQFTFYPPISVARKSLVNAFDLLAQSLVIVFTTFSMLFVGFVVKRAGREARYLAGFRN
jgi:heme/copper-type cytochrome/quinol oxidase subunit 1